MRKYVKRFVECRHVQRAILLIILLNSMSMGIEYHEQVGTHAPRAAGSFDPRIVTPLTDVDSLEDCALWSINH